MLKFIRWIGLGYLVGAGASTYIEYKRLKSMDPDYWKDCHQLDKIQDKKEINDIMISHSLHHGFSWPMRVPTCSNSYKEWIFNKYGDNLMSKNKND